MQRLGVSKGRVGEDAGADGSEVDMEGEGNGEK